MPTSAQRSRRNCRQKICHGERPMSSLGISVPGSPVSTSASSTNWASLPRPDRVPEVPGASSDPWSSPGASCRSSLTGADDRPLRTRRQRGSGRSAGHGQCARETGQESAILRDPRRQSRTRALSLGRICGPSKSPSEPLAHARSPNEWCRRRHRRPLTSSGTGSAVCALRRHDVAWSAVRTATTVSGPSRGRTSPKNARSIAVMTSRLSSARPSCAGTSGP